MPSVRAFQPSSCSSSSCSKQDALLRQCCQEVTLLNEARGTVRGPDGRQARAAARKPRKRGRNSLSNNEERGFRKQESHRRAEPVPDPFRSRPEENDLSALLFRVLAHSPSVGGLTRAVSLIKRENVAGSRTLNLIRPFWWKKRGQGWHRVPHLRPGAAALLAWPDGGGGGAGRGRRRDSKRRSNVFSCPGK